MNQGGEDLDQADKNRVHAIRGVKPIPPMAGKIYIGARHSDADVPRRPQAGRPTGCFRCSALAGPVVRGRGRCGRTVSVGSTGALAALEGKAAL